jgi:hypothetical protein
LGTLKGAWDAGLIAVVDSHNGAWNASVLAGTSLLVPLPVFHFLYIVGLVSCSFNFILHPTNPTYNQHIQQLNHSNLLHNSINPDQPLAKIFKSFQHKAVSDLIFIHT